MSVRYSSEEVKRLPDESNWMRNAAMTDEQIDAAINKQNEERDTVNDLVKQSNDLATDIGQTDEISWVPNEDMTYEQYERIGRTFQQIKSSLAWWVGDWLNFGERKFGEMAMQAVEDTGKTMETLLKWKAVSYRVDRDIRRADLGWTHHFYVAYVLEEQRGLLLDLAANVELSSRELKDVVKLDDERRSDLLIAYQNYLEEEGQMTHETFMKLLNVFRLKTVEKPERDDDEEDEDEEDEDGDEEETVLEDATEDDVIDFFENVGVPITSYGPYIVAWEGMTVRAALKNGKPFLMWGRIDEQDD